MRVLAGLVLGIALLGACGDDTASTSDHLAQDAGDTAVDPEILTVYAVLREVPPPCDAVVADPAAGEQAVVAEPDDEAPTACLVLGPPALDATDVADAFLVASPGSDVESPFSVGIDLTPAGDEAFNELAAAQYPVQGRIAILARGRFSSAPTVEQPSFGPDNGIAVGGLSGDEAVALVTDLGGDPTPPADDGAFAEGDEAAAICDGFATQAGEGAETALSASMTAGLITEVLGDAAIEPWRSLPADHVVAQCGYTVPGADVPATTVCADGNPVTIGDAYLVDADGNSTPFPADLGQPGGCS